MPRYLKPYLLAIFALTLSLVAPTAQAEDRYIQVRTTKIRSAPHHWSSGVQAVAYGDKVTVLEESGGWLKVQAAGGLQGYLHQSATSSRKVALSTATAAGRAPDEVDAALAGKGFSKDVEKSYASGSGELNYPAVDQMEALNVSETELSAFIKAGRLNHAG